MRFSILHALVAVLLLAFLHKADAQVGPSRVDQFWGKRIVRIEYAPAQILDPADLAAAQPLKEGTPLEAAEVAGAIDALYATGRFADIAVEAEASGQGVLV